MIGPHYERLAQMEQKMTGKQLLEKIKSRPDNPLTRIVDKLKRQFSEYETAYSDPMMDFQITSLDRILSFDSKLGPILDALEKENQLLRKELGILEGQLSNTVGICQQILSENNELKVIIKRKNEDIAKIIDTIAHNQAEGMDELQEKNRLLMEENSILLRHLEEVKRQQEKYDAIFRSKDQQKHGIQKKFQELKKQLTESISRERQLSRKISLLEQNMYQKSEDAHQLQQANQNLTFENNELKNQLVLMKGNVDVANAQVIRKKIENEFEPIIDEHKLLKKERAQLLREAEKAKLDKEKLEDIQDDFQRKINKLTGDLELTNSLLSQKRNENAYLSNSQGKIEAKLNELKEQNNRLKAEKQTGSTYAIGREKRLLQQIDELRRQVDQKNVEKERNMRQLKDQMQGLLQSNDLEIKRLTEDKLQLQRLLDRR